MNTALRLTGVGLRPAHYSEFIEHKPGVAWIEVHSENYFGEGGNHLQMLTAIRKNYPVSLHGVNLSIASTDEINWRYLTQLKELINRVDPCLVSDHLCWSSIQGQYLHDLLPLPFTDEALAHVVSRIQCIQDFLQRQILIENITRYIDFPQSTYSEWEFITAVAQQAGCGILLDVSNVYVNAINLGFHASNYISSLTPEHIQQIHLGGFTESSINNNNILIDSHDKPIHANVWELFQETIQRVGHKPTIIEWDNHLPPLDTLMLEAYRAENIMREIYVTAKRTG